MHLRRSLACALLPTSVFGAGAVYLHGHLTPARLLIQASGFVEPQYVQAGVPFIVRDSYATLLCISNRSGYPLQPFILPGKQTLRYRSGAAPAHVQAGVPFIVHDAKGAQLCVSNRSGQPLPPYLGPS
jgi:hypothetical protein